MQASTSGSIIGTGKLFAGSAYDWRIVVEPWSMTSVAWDGAAKSASDMTIQAMATVIRRRSI